MVLHWRIVAVLCMLTSLMFSAVVMIAPAASADSGTLTVSPGETRYVSFGSCGVNELVFWSVEVSTLSSVFSAWVEPPDGTHNWLDVSAPNVWGRITDQAGEWRLGFAIDASGYWDATVYWTANRVIPSLEIIQPGNDVYSKTPLTRFSGHFDGSADYVEVSLDNVHFVQADADPLSKIWSTQMQLEAGSNTFYARSVFVWGGYSAYFTIDPVTVTLDTTLPTLTVTAPSAAAHMRGNYVTIAWQSSDDYGIAKTELWNGVAWVEVQGTSCRIWMPTGHHDLQVRVTDYAGNQAISPVTFSSDSRALSFGGPYYGLPIIAIIAAVVLVGLLMFTRIRKKRHVPAPEPAPEPEATPKEQKSA